jgi:hypothetical protein
MRVALSSNMFSVLAKLYCLLLQRLFLLSFYVLSLHRSRHAALPNNLKVLAVRADNEEQRAPAQEAHLVSGLNGSQAQTKKPRAGHEQCSSHSDHDELVDEPYHLWKHVSGEVGLRAVNLAVISHRSTDGFL